MSGRSNGSVSSAWALALSCALAAFAALLAPARAQTHHASAAVSAPLVHGIAPMPGGAPVPEALRPPGAFPGDGGPSPVIFPPQTLGIRFSHVRHVQGLGMTCTTCHERAKTSVKSADSLLPEGSRCDACHGSNHRASPVTGGSELSGQCGFCHLGYRPDDGQRVSRLEIPPPNLRFNHALHGKKQIECARCHGDVGALELATHDQLPRMRGCFSCHESDSQKPGVASRACSTCHLTERGSMLDTSLPQGKLLPPAWLHDAEHGADWIERHKHIAGDDGRFCANCHSERFCSGCHDGRVRSRRVHPNDFLSMHPVQARRNEPRCTSCHQQQSFCVGCHQRAGVTLSGPLPNLASRGRFHPPQSIWTDEPRSAGHHAWEAQRNLNACVSCHVERDCATCHATSARGGRGAGPLGGRPGQGTNPHPAGFLARCGRALQKNARPCLVCHDPADPTLAECR